MHKFQVKSIIRQPNNNVTIQFEDTLGTFPIYKAGQFLTLCFTFGEREVRRSYSFSSSPDVNEPIAITVKRVDNGEISRLLHHKLEVGDVIDVLDPQGLFYYEPQQESDNTLFLFGAGVGITPLFSILKTALTKENHSKVILVYSNSSKEQTIFYEELQSWQEKYPERLSIYWLFSNSKNLLNARLNRDYVIQIVNKHSESIDNSIFYTCGPIFYMDLCRFTLLGMGFPDEHIRKETFHFPEEEEDDDEHDAVEVDTKSYSVKLIFQENEYNLLVPYDQTILNIGLDHKIKLPYSCKSGMCSTCISQVTSGAVRMDYNEVLTDREVENGKCLICTSHPLENGTTIEVY
ncbi:2Fe-2S iron-sulfur cluster-binding protein [Sphingobacterium hungaricum]|uniref:Phenylacetic acid degradation protein n=1 Tax=Sphingobacterium hungaricum TaxID=2082723 RepID=A0A928YQF6_9SPHI|nr:2Fe-2S iron-sulfur cluster-binding protein [Sphingobacterium hungaricum]MBE8712333.1 phenylacetic acid degradation protein [Sphingobacterium hungaricum]